MTYDSSVFSRGNYYKDSFYFKNTKGFRHIFTVNIPLHSKKNVPCCFERDNPCGIQPRKHPNQGIGGGFRPEPPPWRTFGQAKKNSAPETRDGRSFKAGWRIASAGVINRHRFRCCKITLRLFHRCDSPVTIPGIWHCTHVAAAGKAARPHHPATKAACPDCKRPGRPCRITGSATIAIRRRPASHSGRAGIIPYSHSMVAGGFEEMS